VHHLFPAGFTDNIIATDTLVDIEIIRINNIDYAIDDLVSPFTFGDDVQNGTTGTDIYNGLSGNDVIYGLGGNDIIEGFDGDDQLFGGDGNDILMSGSGIDMVYGGNGDDVIVLDYYNFEAGETYDGGVGNDTLQVDADFGQDSRVTFNLASGTFTYDSAAYTIPNFTVGDTVAITSFENFDQIWGRYDGYITVNGTNGDNVINITTNRGSIRGYDGDDTINGSSQTDNIIGGWGADAINGGGGADRIYFLRIYVWHKCQLNNRHWYRRFGRRRHLCWHLRCNCHQL